MLILVIINILIWVGIILYLKYFKYKLFNDMESRIKILNHKIDNSILNVIKMGTNIKQEVLEEINKSRECK